MTSPAQIHLTKLDQLINNLEPWQDKFTIEIDQLKHIKNLYSDKLERFSKEEQTLNIAIMGQVKAGKSSFLNALLFDGKPILPEAATPKTANLTRISYDTTHRLEVEFYNQSDWQRITDLANSDGQHQEAKVAREQVDMVRQAGIDPIATIEQGIYTKQAETTDEIMQILNDYAGNDGKYTGLVKMIRLFLPMPELQGFNVIDTPGMNDPVLSRTQRTKEEMANSDVVFFLSRASNFLDASDIDLLGQQLPEAGIKRLVLVAGQYDSAIEQDGYNRDSLEATEKNLKKRIGERANTDLSKLAKQKELAGQQQVGALLRSMTEPVFSSTYAYGFANWDEHKWNPSMKHTYTQLTEMAEDEWGSYEFTQADWQRIAGFDPLIQSYENAKADKINIIEEQKQGLLPEAQTNLKNWLNSFSEQVHQRIITLEKGDMAELEKRQKQYQVRINNVASRLEDVIEQAIQNASDRQREISRDLKKGIQENSQLKTRTGTETHEESYTVSTSKWYKPWTWGSTETRYRTISVNYEYVSPADAVDQVTNFAYQCVSDIEYHFSQMVNPNDIKAKLRKSLLDVLDTQSSDFDPTQFRTILNQSISRIEIPQLKFDIGDAGSQISRNFTGEVRADSDRAKLQSQLRDALHQVFNTLNTEFTHAVSQLSESLNKIKANLEVTLTDNIQNELSQLKQDMANKQQSLKDYQQLEHIIQEA
ncbi:dynamin family protein [Moraxella sp. PS-22]|uniref:Dynamin family protein n=1 Tax=Moraxella tetraodonis TaxID=2767221 RepID=A0A9X2A4E3_9GAMM|nr:dynamin family protein [Moraxella tetraodonis]MCG8147154.1 dynamin family protein [Moraxella tetraodonis]